MKKIKSIFAFLLFGSLTLSGCAFLDFFKGKKSNDTPADTGGGGDEGGGGEHTEEKFTVTFNVQGHGSAPASVEVDKGGKVTKPNDPSAEGYTFGGWFKEAACENAWDFANDTVTADVTLYAKWTENGGEQTEKFTVTFNVQGHGQAPASVEVDKGGKVTKPNDPVAEGYTFGGWFTEAACTNEWHFDSDTVSADTTLYAKWTENAEDLVSVTFNLQGHGENWHVAVKLGETVSKPETDPSASGYTFDGWFKEESCTTPFDFTEAISVDTVIYAKWTEEVTPPTPSKATIKVTHGTTTTPHNLSKASEEASEYFVKELKIEGGDTIEIEVNGVIYGIATFKAGGESAQFEEVAEKITCKETHDYDIYVETDVTKADEAGKLVYIDCEDYIKYSVPSQGENVWATKKVEHKAESTSEYEIELALEKGAKFMFDVHDVVDEVPGRHYYKTIKEGGAKLWINAPENEDPEILVGGTYHLYCQTPAQDVAVGIFATAIHSGETNYVEVKTGSADPVITPLTLKVEEEVTSYDEFKTELALADHAKVRFFVNGEWIDEFKDGAPAASKFEEAGEDHYFEVKEGYGGDFVFYSKFLGENQGIWALGGGEIETSVVLTVNGTPHALAKKGETSEYYITGVEIEAGDEITITVDEETFGIDKFKAGGAAAQFELESEKVTCQEAHEYDFYVETDPDKAVEGKLVYIDCEDYIKYSIPSAGENVWATAKVAHKVDIVEEEPVESQFEYEIEIALEKGAKFMFNVHDNAGRDYYKAIKNDSPAVSWINTEGSDPEILVGGTYHMYCQTPEEFKATGIYVLATPDAATNYVEVIASGESEPARTALHLKEEAQVVYYDEFFQRLELGAGDKVRFVVNGQALNALKTDEGSADANFNAADVNNFFEVKSGKGGIYDFYLAIFGEGARIWVQEYHEPVLVAHRFILSEEWMADPTGEYYLWVWGGSDSGHWEKLEIEDDGIQKMLNVSLYDDITNGILFRFRKAATHKPDMDHPTVYSMDEVDYSVGSGDSVDAWNKTGELTIPSSAGVIPFSF